MSFKEELCLGCGKFFRETSLTVDHIQPRNLGGSDLISNLQLLCQSCNSTKHTGTQQGLWARLRQRGIETKPQEELWARLRQQPTQQEAELWAEWYEQFELSEEMKRSESLEELWAEQQEADTFSRKLVLLIAFLVIGLIVLLIALR